MQPATSPYLLYGSRRSGSLTVELTLAALGLSAELVEIDLRADMQREAAYAAINPQRKLPCLITPEGETLTETLAILLILDERHPNAGLMPPPGSAERASALRWLVFIATELYPVVEINDYPERFAPNAATSAQVRETARKIWRERWLLVENNVAGKPFFLARGFSLCDIYIAVVSRWAQQDRWRSSNLPRIETLPQAVAELPNLGSIWRRHRPDDTPARFAPG